MNRFDLRKVLICRLSALGDLVVLSPIFQLLKEHYPESEIHLVTKEYYEPLFRHNPYIDTIWGFNPSRGFWGWRDYCHLLFEEKFTLYIDMHNNLRSRILGKHLYNVPLLRFKKPEIRRRLLFYFYLNLFPRDFTLLKSYIEHLSPLGIEYSPGITPRLYLDENLFTSKLATLQYELGENYVVFLPIAAWRRKRWPLANYTHLATQLIHRYQVKVVFLAGERDDYIREEDLPIDENFRLYQGYFDLEETLHVIAGSRLVIGNDTGLTHAAEALEVPTICILGPTSRETGASFYRDSSYIMEQRLWCRPCSQNGKRRCYRLKQHCLTRTRPEDIIDLIEQRDLLKQPQPGG